MMDIHTQGVELVIERAVSSLNSVLEEIREGALDDTEREKIKDFFTDIEELVEESHSKIEDCSTAYSDLSDKVTNAEDKADKAQEKIDELRDKISNFIT